MTGTKASSTTTRRNAVASFVLSSLLLSSAGAFSPLARAVSVAAKPTTAAAVTTPLFASVSTEQDHAREVFAMVDTDGSGTVSSSELGQMLRMLDIEASDEDAEALYKYLNTQSDNEGIGFDEFEPWYADATLAAQSDALIVQDTLLKRKTVNFFDKTAVSDNVLRRAVECAISSPSIGGRLSERWGFVHLGPSAIEKVAQLKSEMLAKSEREGAELEGAEFTPEILRDIPGWCVITTELTPNDKIAELEDYAATCCAIQNFMNSMWAEGVGTKWTSGPVTRTDAFAALAGVDTSRARVVGCIWYGFARGGLANVKKTPRTKGVEDVLSSVA